MLILGHGLPVALTDHIDRSPDKLLLRGRVGHVHSWIWAENDRLPTVVYVKFPGATWKLNGIDEPGVYPIQPARREWYLDKNRKPKVLKVIRRQLPLTPAFAMTAHASQGKTLRAVLLDLNVDKRVDATFGTVAASRVCDREDVLILRPFPLFLFHRGAAEGPHYLLATLRGERIDWDAYRDAKAPAAPCDRCKTAKPLHQFDHANWDKIRANRTGTCLRCIYGAKAPPQRRLQPGAAKRLCDKCQCHKIEDAFPPAQLNQTGTDVKTYCLACCKTFAALRCSKCTSNKLAQDFVPSMITMPAACAACKSCQEQAMEKARRNRDGWITCRSCGGTFPRGGISVSSTSQQRFCLNCTGTRQQGEHTCRTCGKKWKEQQARDRRQRLCPQCRRSKQALGPH